MCYLVHCMYVLWLHKGDKTTPPHELNRPTRPLLFHFLTEIRGVLPTQEDHPPAEEGGSGDCELGNEGSWGKWTAGPDQCFATVAWVSRRFASQVLKLSRTTAAMTTVPMMIWL